MKPRPTAGAGPKATIFDVARHASVSIKTVSRVVNNESNVREATRESVRASIKALDYRPNPAARGLSAKRSYVIGLIYENAEEFSYTKDLLGGVLAACDSLGYSLLLRPVTLPSEDLASTAEAFIRQTSADGIVLPAPIADVDAVQGVLSRLGTAVAAISPKRPAWEYISVYCDDARATYALTEYLLGERHERIGFIKGHPAHWATAERLRGYKHALDAHGVAFETNMVRDGLFTYESGREATESLLQCGAPPTAIIASNDEMACGVMHAALELGLDVPRDVSIVGFDDTPVASRLWPPLTTVRQPIHAMAEAATTMLIQQLRGGLVEAEHEPFHCEVVIRESTGPRLVD